MKQMESTCGGINIFSNPELEGEIYYLTEPEGGRSHPVMSGYRGQFHYNGRDWDAPQEFIDKEICNLGETVKVRLRTLSPDFHVGQFHVGQTFETREGAKTVGRGKITRILRQDFNYWDFESFFDCLPANCKPFDMQNTESFIENVEIELERIKHIDAIKFTNKFSCKNQMLTIECKIKDKEYVGARPLVDEICDIWRDKIRLKESHYKTCLTFFDNRYNRFRFELIFATWNDMYLTGKLIVDTRNAKSHKRP